MKIIQSSFQILNVPNREAGFDLLKRIEAAGRTCYKSEDKITDTSAETFVKNIMKSGHESVIEHVDISVRIICDRGVSHEIVRHRMASYSQESTRYCNYCKDKFGNELTFIAPSFWLKNPEDKKEMDCYDIWHREMQSIERAYFNMIEAGATPQEARSVLPNSLKTELVMTANPRSWRNFFRLRTSSSAHPQIKEIAIQMLNQFKELIPVLFDDI